MKTGLSLMLLAEDNAADADLILASLTKDGFAGAVQVVRDGVETLDFAFCRGEYANRDRDLCLRQHVALEIDPRCELGDGDAVGRQLHHAALGDVGDVLALRDGPLA